MSPSTGTAVSAAQSAPASNGSRVVTSTSGRPGLSHHQVLASASRMAVLELLRSRARPLGVGEVAEQVGLHQNTVRSHLDLLVDAGYAIRRSEAPSGPGRPRVVYEATAAPEGERNYRLLAEVLAQHLFATSERPGEAAVNAGRSWAGLTGQIGHSGQSGQSGQSRDGDPRGPTAEPPISEEAAIAAVVRMLGDIGFAPEVSADGTAINLHRCPFRELAESNPDVVCGAHLGMIQGALAEVGHHGQRHPPAPLRHPRPVRHHPDPIGHHGGHPGRELKLTTSRS